MYFVWGVVALSFFWPQGSAFGNTISIPGAARIERQDKSLPDYNVIGTGVSSKFDTSQMPIAIRPANAGSVPLTLSAIQLEGITVYNQAVLSALWQERIGQPGTLADLYDIADAITRHYRTDGYLVARAFIPEQDIINGVVRIEIAEGRIGQVNLTGDIPRTTLVQNAIEKIKSREVINIRHLEEAVLRLDDLAGVRFQLALKPSDGDDTRVDVEIVGQPDDGYRGEVSFSSNGSRFLGPNLLAIPLEFFGVFQPYDTLGLSFNATIPTKEMRNAGLSYRMPLACGITIGASGGLTRGTPGYTLSDDQVRSVLKDVDVYAEYAAVRQRTRSLTVSIGAGAQQARTEVSGTRLSRDQLRHIYIEGNFSSLDKGQGLTHLRTRLERGLGGFLGGSRDGDADLSRAAGKSDYTRMIADLSYIRPLGPHFSVFAAVNGQIASDPLLSTTEFGYGGSLYGRAYDPSQYVGDSGVASALELRGQNIDLGHQVTFQPFLFADYGRAWNRDAGQADVESGASAGIGLRFMGPSGLSGGLFLARPLLNHDDPIYRRVKDNRFVFSISKQF